MDVSLAQDLEKQVSQEIEAGRYPDASALVSEALRFYLSALQARRADLDAAIDVGLADIAAGRVFDGEGTMRQLLQEFGEEPAR